MSLGTRLDNLEEKVLMMSDELMICRSFFMDNNLPKANWFEIFLLLLGRRKRFCVSGNSMLPCLKNGDEVIIKPKAKLKIGDIVLANHPYKTSVKIVKRVSGIDENGRFFLLGDNPEESTDSRTFGPISADKILGTVASKVKPELS